VPNRKITQFPAITASEINDNDLLTTVSVFEVDPALRNKKITFTNFRDYLDQYYINSFNFDPLVAINVIISSGCNVSGLVSLSSGLNVSGITTFSQDVTVTGDFFTGGAISAGGTISGNYVDVGTITTDQIEVQGTGTFITATGQSSNFVNGNYQQTYIFTASGQNSNYVNGNFSVLTADIATIGTLDISGITITGDVVSSGTIDANNINATGTISGTTITGDLVNIDVLNTQSGYFEYLSGNTITGNTVEIHSGIVANLDVEQSELNQAIASGLYAYNLTGLVTTIGSGFVQDDLFVSGTLSGAYITGETLNTVSAYIDTFTGAFISGEEINAGLINVNILNAANLSFSGDQTVSGDFGVVGNILGQSGVFANQVVGSGSVSGNLISGISGIFSDLITVPTLDSSSGLFETIIVSGTATITGDTTVGGNLVTSGNSLVRSDLTVDGNTNVNGTLTITGETTLESGLSVTDNVYFGSGLVVSGDTTISGNALIHGDLVVSGGFQISGGDIIVDDLQVLDDAWFGGDISVSGNAAISGSTLISGITTIENNVFISSGLTVTGDILAKALVSGQQALFDTSVSATTITGTSGQFTEVTGQQGDFVSGSYDDLDVIDTLRVPFGDLTSPGVSFVDFGSSNTVFDGILISKPDLSDNHIMTFVNQNTSGMSLTSGTLGFVLTIWGN
jgi:acetyltransferase-like isoleucine patch superfamily enzyme